MYCYYVVSALVATSILTCAKPFEHDTGLQAPGHASPARRDMDNFSVQDVSDSDVFSQDELSNIIRELNDVVVKYRDAGEILNGVNLNQPDVYSGGDGDTTSGGGANSTSTSSSISPTSISVNITLPSILSIAAETVESATTTQEPTARPNPSSDLASTSTPSPLAEPTSLPINGVQIPLSPDASIISLIPPILDHSASPLDVISQPLPPATPLAKRVIPGSAKIGVNDFFTGSMDVMYWGNMQVGSTGQSLGVALDTGSSDLWLPVNCTTNCENKIQMRSQDSSTFVGSSTKFAVQYGAGSASGTLAQDTVSLGGIPVSSQYWGAVTAESEDFARDPNSGFLGLAFGSIAASGKTPYFENLINNNQVSAPMFSFQLLAKKSTGSQLCLGCYDSSRYTGNVVWTPVVSQTYWSLSLTGITADGKHNAVDKSIIGAIDTGTSLIYLPARIANSFYGQIPGAATANQYGQGFYTFPCSSKLSLTISFANKVFLFDMAQFNLGKTSSGSGSCVGGVIAVGSGFPDNIAIVGDVFLKTWYSIYDYSNGVRVGFAQSSARS